MRESRSSGDSRSRPRGPWRANLEPRRTTSAVAGLIVRAAATCIPAPDSRQTPGPGGFSQGRLCVYVRQDETSRLLKPGRVASQLPGWHRPGQRDNPRRCASVIRRLRPAPGWLPSPSTPAAWNRCSQRRTVFSWQPISAAIAGTPSPSQLSVMIGPARSSPPGHAGSLRACGSSWLRRHRAARALLSTPARNSPPASRLIFPYHI
jgi:hypothetical protein